MKALKPEWKTEYTDLVKNLFPKLGIILRDLPENSILRGATSEYICIL